MPYDRNRPWRRSPLPPGWARIRLRVLERDGYECQLRDRECCIGVATEVDHIGDRDDHSDGNLRSVCTPCHRRRTGQVNQAKRPQRRRPPEAHPGMIEPTWPAPGGHPRAYRQRPDGSFEPIE